MQPKLKEVSRAQPRASGIKPSRTLGKHGLALWQSVMSDYDISDCAGIEMLTQACQQLDCAENLRAHIARDGEIIPGKNGTRPHPGLKQELACRAFVVRTLERLGLDVQAIKPKGRPGRPVHWQGDAG